MENQHKTASSSRGKKMCTGGSQNVADLLLHGSALEPHCYPPNLCPISSMPSNKSKELHAPCQFPLL